MKSTSKKLNFETKTQVQLKQEFLASAVEKTQVQPLISQVAGTLPNYP
ncbi:hypothetical protein MtrunA17_Chr4g0038721 [Medicago truncatula]|uniref:Uncharacterized protein n=1 Tax=Medicago truncatula TaxID=3880 RepID=A0A396I7N1_MEDTR|nr:hypothetical protein MtrunA17_Chr4g0038721 [Medicago truncatula]